MIGGIVVYLLVGVVFGIVVVDCSCSNRPGALFFYLLFLWPVFVLSKVIEGFKHVHWEGY